MDKVRLKDVERSRKYRKRKRQERLKLKNDTSVTLRGDTDKDIEEDIDIDKGEKKGKYSDEHLRLAKKSRSNSTEDSPKEMDEVDIEKWADAIGLMEERDKISTEAIGCVISWLPTNEFWSGNIGSAKKPREKFEGLKFRIKADKSNHEKQSQKLQYSNPNEYDDLPI